MATTALLTMIDGGLLNSRNSILFLKLCAIDEEASWGILGERLDGDSGCPSPKGRGSAIDMTSVCLDTTFV